jgi:hypothetical protein
MSKPPCSIAGCPGKYHAKNLCRKHYNQQNRRKWYEKNKERQQQLVSIWKKKNWPRVLELARARYKRDRDNKKLRSRKWARTAIGQYRTLCFNAKKRGYEVSLTLEEFTTLRNNACFYCTGPLPLVGHGLDRLDNNEGYSKDNVVPCCTICNKARGTWWTPDETMLAVQTVQKYRLLLNEARRPLKIIKS